jgi:hypothetical protein
MSTAIAKIWGTTEPLIVTPLFEMHRWTEDLGLSHSAVHMRLRRGWSVTDAISLPRYARVSGVA